MLSHELRKNKIDGEKQIIQNPGEKQRSEMTKCSFEKYEVYAIDILMSTGEGISFFPIIICILEFSGWLF